LHLVGLLQSRITMHGTTNIKKLHYMYITLHNMKKRVNSGFRRDVEEI